MCFNIRRAEFLGAEWGATTGESCGVRRGPQGPDGSCDDCDRFDNLALLARGV